MHVDSPAEQQPRATGELLRSRELGAGGYAFGLSCVELGGRTMVIAGHLDGSILLVDLYSMEQVGAAFAGHTDLVRGVAVVRVGDRRVLVSGGNDATVRLWDLSTRQPIGSPLSGHDGAVRCLTVAEVDGRPVAVTGGQDGTIRRWDLLNAGPLDEPIEARQAMLICTLAATVAARPVLLSGGDNGTLRTWDLRTGTEIDKPLHHDGSVTAIGVTELGGRQVLITVSADHPGHLFYGGTLRVWDLEDHTLVGGPQPIPNSWIKTVAATQLDGRRVAVVAGDGKGGGDPRVVDLAGRSQVGTPTRGHHSRVADLAATTIDERPVLVSAGQDHQLMLWDEKTGQPHELHLDRLPYPVAAVCCAHIGDRPMAAALSYHRLRDGWEIRSWWLPDGEPIGPPITGSGQVFDQFSTEIHTGGAPIVAGSVDGRPTAYTHFRSRVDAWDLRTGQPAGSTDFTELVDTAPLLSAEVTLASLPGNPLAIISHRLGDARDQDSARTALCVYGLHDQELLGRATMQRPLATPSRRSCSSPSVRTGQMATVAVECAPVSLASSSETLTHHKSAGHDMIAISRPASVIDSRKARTPQTSKSLTRVTSGRSGLPATGKCPSSVQSEARPDAGEGPLVIGLCRTAYVGPGHASS